MAGQIVTQWHSIIHQKNSILFLYNKLQLFLSQFQYKQLGKVFDIASIIPLYKLKCKMSLKECMKITQCNSVITEKHKMLFSQEIQSIATCMQNICVCEIFSTHKEIYLFIDCVRRNKLFLQIPIIKDWKNKALDRKQCRSVAELFRTRKVLQHQWTWKKETSYNLPKNVAGII